MENQKSSSRLVMLPSAETFFPFSILHFPFSFLGVFVAWLQEVREQCEQVGGRRL